MTPENDLKVCQITSTGFLAYAIVAGAISFSGWPLNIPRLTDWFNDSVSIQPNTAVLIVLSGIALLLVKFSFVRTAFTLGMIVALAGAMNLLQYIIDVDFGFNDLLLFDRSWGQDTTMTPGRFGPPASLSFILIGSSLVLLSLPGTSFRRYVPGLALLVLMLMTFSLIGYMFEARNFYAIPWLSAIALPSSTMFLALSVSLIVHVKDHHPMLLICERTSAGTMARTVIPILVILIPLVIWLRTKGYEYNLFDLGTSRALGATVLLFAVVLLMWFTLAALRQRELASREADVRKDEFLAILAHELRNPLAPISNALSILKLTPEDPAQVKLVGEMASRQLTLLVRIVDDLLDVSRISCGKLELRKERVELAPIIHQAIETCRTVANTRQLELEVILPEQPVWLYADPVRLTQIVSNLLNNAFKFSNHTGRIKLTVKQENNQIIISVKDNGIGIDPEKIEGIFELFSQVDSSLERSRSGLGIGLAMVKRLAELHEGTVEARSEGLGQGAEFIVRLPIVLNQPLAEIMADPVFELNQQTKPLRILIVDDLADNSKSMATLLGMMGHQTRTASDGFEAMTIAEQFNPDVICLDIGMPHLNGLETCRRIRQQTWGKNIFIIALTGWGQEDDRRKTREAGFDYHIVKPFGLSEINAVLDSAKIRQAASSH